jgi:hypothetical protein
VCRRIARRETRRLLAFPLGHGLLSGEVEDVGERERELEQAGPRKRETGEELGTPPNSLCIRRESGTATGLGAAAGRRQAHKEMR